MTTALLDPTTRASLRSKAEVVEDLVEPGADRRRDWYRRVEDAVLDLVNALPAGTEDYEARQLFVFLTELRRAIDEETDSTDRVQLAAMKMGDVVRRMDRRLEHAVLENPEGAARFVFEQMDAVGATELARLLGVSTKTIGAWRSGRPVKQKVERVKLVAQLVAYLRYTMTQSGLVMWFGNEADALGGRSPLELLDESVGAAWEPLVAYARGGRAQLAG
jgi:transcriptional regulator with XRE-family HTH domain